MRSKTAPPSSTPMSARDKVREHWASLGTADKRVGRTTAPRPAGGPGAPIYTPFKLVHSAVFDGPGSPNCPTFSLETILASPNLTEIWLFSFGFQTDLFMPLVKDHVQVHIVGQLNTIQSDVPLHHFQNLSVHKVDIGARYGCHHAKIIFAFYKNGHMQMHLPSFNLAREEINLVQQVAWSSPVLYERVGTVPATESGLFYHELIQFLKSYPDYCALSPLIASLARYKWHVLDQQNCQFVYSTPSNGGLQQLKKCLQRSSSSINAHDDESSSYPNLFVQVSSMGNPFRKNRDLLQDAFIPYLYTDWFEHDDFDKKLKSPNYTSPFLAHSTILWPTTNEMNTCMTQGLSAGWFFYNKSHQTAAKVLPCLRKHPPLRPNASQSQANRHMVPSHTKYYIQYTDENSIHCPDWLLLTSHNLSQAAWGPTPLRKPMNYECGVLYTSTLGPHRVNLALHSAFESTTTNPRLKPKSDPTVNIITPYPLKLDRYSSTDTPHTTAMA